MKKTRFIQLGILTSALSLSMGTAFAQQVNNNFFQNSESLTIENFNSGQLNLNFNLPHQQTNNLEKPTAIKSRLVAMTKLKYDGVFFLPVDSGKYYWGGTKNVDFDLATFILSKQYIYPDFSTPKPEDKHWSDLTIVPSDTVMAYQWDGVLSTYNKNRRTINEFDANGNVTEVNSVVFDEISSIWENESRRIIQYDGNGNIVSSITQEWDIGSSTWKNQRRVIFEYNTQNKITQATRSTWDNPASNWRNVNRYNYSYDANNNWTEEITQTWKTATSVWENSNKYIRSYDAKNLITNYIIQSWHSASSSWNNSSKREYNYNSDDLLESDISYFWDNPLSTWELNSKTIYTYNAAKDIQNVFIQEWSLGSWVYQTKIGLEYANTKLIRLVLSAWDNATNSFKGSVRYNYLLNADYLYSEYFIESFDAGTEQWTSPLNTIKVRFHYGKYDDGQDNNGINNQLAQNEFSVYPNPANDVVNIKMNDANIQNIRIVDISGKVVFETKGNTNINEAKIPTSQLSNGVYLLQAQSNGKIGTKTFVIQR